MSSSRRLLGSLPTNILLVVLALVVALLPLILSEPLVRRMADEERLKMQTWAEATECIASQSDEQLNALALQILESNTTIPLILTDSLGNILGYKNIDSVAVARDSTYLAKRLTAFRSGYAPIEIDLGTAGRQYLYYSDSSNLRRLLRFPYLQTGIFILYIIILVLTIRSLLHWEQDRIWVGLSKETAHQLGTPISSLMAWTELLKSYDLPPEIIESIGQDVNRLELIAHRFQKVGSLPELTPIELNGLVATSVQYLSRRISRQVEIVFEPAPEELYCLITPDLMSWVVENIVKNGVDAMDGKGTITITTEAHGKNAYLEITDTGRGMTRATQRMIFKPGFTTKERGWGLGLSLARRIIRHYFRGRIYVKRSELQVGTTFRITLPLQPLP
ncbi:HAMP domain-containing sensor histidine kinase [uncultured Porphyromonas sp.]|uniref:sensor histidine kinase n=1 Tax=uncultured Porphyromonas sp. TaxID=159274 RepID=UPI0028053F59|nr:HAMP domain-containing sensor histidine kinase [uncultured Porphyromonas sp.]